MSRYDDKFEAALEAAYWSFDSRRAGRNRLGPQSDRDAFKSVAREFLRIVDLIGVETTRDGSGNEVPVCAMDGCMGCGMCRAWSQRDKR